MLNCQKIGENSYQFYFAYEQCYGRGWIICLIVLCIIIVLFTLIFVKLRNMKPLERADKTHILSSFVSKYKPQYYFWEYIIFMRRICIAMFSVSATDNNDKVVFIMVMFAFSFLQHQYE
eukprot:69926_1